MEGLDHMPELSAALRRCEKPDPLNEFAVDFVYRDRLERLWTKTKYTLVVDDFVAECHAAQQLCPVAGR